MPRGPPSQSSCWSSSAAKWETWGGTSENTLQTSKQVILSLSPYVCIAYEWVWRWIWLDYCSKGEHDLAPIRMTIIYGWMNYELPKGTDAFMAAHKRQYLGSKLIIQNLSSWWYIRELKSVRIYFNVMLGLYFYVCYVIRQKLVAARLFEMFVFTFKTIRWQDHTVKVR